jgi:hypothetical protein
LVWYQTFLVRLLFSITFHVSIGSHPIWFITT